MTDEDWQDVASSEDVPVGKSFRVSAEAGPVMLYKSSDRVFAISNHCTHQGAPLDKGVVKISGSLHTVTCAAHGSTFDLETGRVMRPPAATPIPVYDVKVEDGRVFVRPKSEG
jgi:3-phenylpropionate/trans-cinnamate dioxygenase ferredoxin subunit